MIVLGLLVIGLILVAFVCVFVPNASADLDSPLNFVMFKSPGVNRYTDQLVNLWIPKPWKIEPSGKIPCRIEYGYRRGIENASRKLIIYSHGNAEDLMSCSQFIRELSEKTMMDVVSWDYSGYGLNPIDKFERTTEGMNLSLKTIINYFTSTGYDQKHILLWGYSLGTGPSVAVASKTDPLMGLVLFGAYSSILDTVREHVHPKVAELFTERWNSKDSISSVTCPILLMHGQSDGLIPCKHSEVLKGYAEKANQNADRKNVKLILFPNVGHTQFSWADTMKEVANWMTENNIV